MRAVAHAAANDRTLQKSDEELDHTLSMTRKPGIGKADRREDRRWPGRSVTQAGLQPTTFVLASFAASALNASSSPAATPLPRHRRELRRIDELAVLLHAEVQVRARRQARRADVADHGLGFDPLADLDVGELRQVHVRGLDAARRGESSRGCRRRPLGARCVTVPDAAAHTGVPTGAA